MVRGVVKVSDTRDVSVSIAECWREVHEVLAVARDLSAGMQDRLTAIAVDEDQTGVTLEGLGLTTLL